MLPRHNYKGSTHLCFAHLLAISWYTVPSVYPALQTWWTRGQAQMILYLGVNMIALQCDLNGKHVEEMDGEFLMSWIWLPCSVTWMENTWKRWTGSSLCREYDCPAVWPEWKTRGRDGRGVPYVVNMIALQCDQNGKHVEEMDGEFLMSWIWLPCSVTRMENTWKRWTGSSLCREYDCPAVWPEWKTRGRDGRGVPYVVNMIALQCDQNGKHVEEMDGEFLMSWIWLPCSVTRMENTWKRWTGSSLCREYDCPAVWPEWKTRGRDGRGVPYVVNMIALQCDQNGKHVEEMDGEFLMSWIWLPCSSVTRMENTWKRWTGVCVLQILKCYVLNWILYWMTSRYVQARVSVGSKIVRHPCPRSRQYSGLTIIHNERCFSRILFGTLMSRSMPWLQIHIMLRQCSVALGFVQCVNREAERCIEMQSHTLLVTWQSLGC